MIDVILLSTFLIASLSTISAQCDSSGVYLSASDFKAHKLALASACLHKRNYVRFHERVFVTVLFNGQRYKYKKQDVFGFKDCSGKDYRIYIDEKYLVLSRENIFLYEITQDVGFGDMVLYETTYFFSETLDSPIYPLTVRYLDWVYKKNFEFVKVIHLSFRKDENLSEYDPKTKQYKLISLYRQSIGLAP